MRFNAQIHGDSYNSTPSANEIATGEGMEFLQSKLEEIDLSSLITAFLESATSVAEDLLYILLFLVFMLTHSEATHSDDGPSSPA